MKIAMIGSGYVGLVVGACLANVGNHVICVDKDPDKIKMLEQGEIPIYEPGLKALVRRNHKDRRLSFTTDTAAGVREAEVVFIAVGTPPTEDGSADLQHVLAVAHAIGESIEDYTVVVCKSTVPVGTCDRVREVIASKTDVEFDVVSNPEFLKEGSAVRDFQSPDRVIIGSQTERAAEVIGGLYAPFMRRSERVLYMDLRSAEMTKYASNAMLATKISFMNEIAGLCDAVGADVEAVRHGMSMDERIGPHFIYPGTGYGGSCFPKDVRALARLGQANERATAILDSVEDVNNRQKGRLFDFACGYFGGDLSGKRFAIWGISFKPNTDDLREAPSLVVMERLLEEGATLIATDPVANENAREHFEKWGDQIQILDDDYQVLEGADGLFLFTEWSEFRSPDFKRMSELMNRPVIFDGRNLYRRRDMERVGFTYFCIGRATVDPSW